MDSSLPGDSAVASTGREASPTGIRAAVPDPRSPASASLPLRASQAIAQRCSPADFSWRYEDGLGLLALDEAAKKPGAAGLGAFVDSVLERLVDAEGGIAGYRRADYNLDQLNPGKLLFGRARGAKGARFGAAIELLRGQLRTQPRTASGGFWHKAIYPEQMWLDGLYMAAPFLLRYGLEYGEEEAVEDALRQLLLVEEKTRDPATGLLKHGWDESRKQAWADPATGLSPCFWGRAMGWYAMALADCIALLAPDSPRRAKLAGALSRLVLAAARVADPATGLWFQVLDRAGAAGNYLEASASSMFVYAMARGLKISALEGEAAEAARSAASRAWPSLIERFVFVDEDGLPSLSGICSVAGLGRSRADGPYRDGSFEYYVSEPVVKNDLKGLGPFILAGFAIEDAGLSGEAEGFAVESRDGRP